MKVHHSLIYYFLFLSLCGGHSGLVSARVNIYLGAEGGTGSVPCTLPKSGSMKFFCKDECKAEDILIKTDGVRAQRGRYSTEFRDHSSGKGYLSVTITHLTKSDSGWYRCGLGGDLVPDSYFDFEVRVVDAATLDVNHCFSRALTEGEDVTFGCLDAVNRKQKFLCKNRCTTQEDTLIETDGNRGQNGRYSIEYREGSVFGLYMTITRVTKSDSGWYKCGYGRASSPELSSSKHISVFDGPKWTPPPPSASTPATTTQSVRSTSGSFTSVSPENTDQFTDYLLPLVISVVVVVVVVVLLVAAVLLLLYERKINRNSDVMNMESVTYENCPQVCTCEDPVYQNLDLATRDLDQIYGTQHP